MLLSAVTLSSISKFTGMWLIGLADVINGLYLDTIIVLCDRFEILSASLAALLANTPIAHIHEGETTAGAFDESIRHSITKIA
jgi:GDP/UDP-N,N'-diacetylbacillosamine 2-epimerase (hydrolysing)